MENNNPPFEITNKMLELVSNIMEKIGLINAEYGKKIKPELRKQNRINSIYSSLAIESNQLSIFQVEDVIDGKIVVGDRKDIQEVKNAYESYRQIREINPYSIKDLKKIHGIMTFLVNKEAGKFRNHSEGVFSDEKCIFICPPEDMVDELMNNLFNWIEENRNIIHPLILSSVFHYEFVFIHPFGDGNGRMARYWQTAILSEWKEIFEYIPIENMIQKNQEEYYSVIDQSNKNGNSTIFIEFMLKMIDKTVDDLIHTKRDLNERKSKTVSDKIIELIIKNPTLTQVDMSEILGVTRDGIAYNLKRLKEENIIKRVGSNKKGKWIYIEDDKKER